MALTAHFTKAIVIGVIAVVVAFIGSKVADSLNAMFGILGTAIAWIAILAIVVGLIYIVLKKVNK